MIDDRTILSEIQRTTLENAGDGGATWPSLMWTLDEVLGYLNQRQNRFLAETLIGWTVLEAPVMPGQAEQPRPADWIAAIQLAYKGNGLPYYLLNRSSLRELDLSRPFWPGTTTGEAPAAVYEVEGDTLTDYLAPIPTDSAGRLERYYVAMGAQLQQTPAIGFSVPDEFVPTIKYGALAEMFSKVGPTANSVLAGMAEERWQEGVEIGKLMSTEGWFLG